MRSEAENAGFTIIEALVALALVTVMLSAIAPLIAVSMRGVRSAEQHVALVATARGVEAGLPDRQRLAGGSLSGERAGHRWRLDVLPYAGGGIVLRPRSHWVPQTIVITVASPSGAIFRIDTVRLYRGSGG